MLYIDTLSYKFWKCRFIYRFFCFSNLNINALNTNNAYYIKQIITDTSRTTEHTASLIHYISFCTGTEVDESEFGQARVIVKSYKSNYTIKFYKPYDIVEG